jgi:hypothetical protein
MIDLTKKEKDALKTSSARAGEYLEYLKKTDMEKFTQKEWSDFIEVIVSGYVEAMYKLPGDEAPF